MSRSSLSEKIYSILPGEQNKRIREAILAAAGYAGQRSNQVRKTIEEPNRLKSGLLTAGTVDFTSTTSADLDLFSWVINYQIFQPGPITKTVTAPHASVPRPDYFVGKADGTIDYRAGTVDAEGNASDPTYNPVTEVLLRRVTRNPDGSNVLDPTEPADDNVKKSASALQTIQSPFAIAPLAGSDPNYMVAGPTGQLYRSRTDQAGIYSTLQGAGGFSRILRINLNVPAQLNYYAVIEFHGVSAAYEKGYLWVQFEVDSGGDLLTNALKCFGEFDVSKYTLVKVDADHYDLFVAHVGANDFYKFRPLANFGGSAIYTYYQLPAKVGSLPVGPAYDFVSFGDLTDILADIATLISDLTDLENQVQDIETEVDDHETRIDALEAASGGGGGLSLVAFSSVIDMTGNFKSYHVQTAAIAYSRTSTSPTTNFENKTVHLIQADGASGKPTFSGDFIVQYDSWNNTAGKLNRLTHIVAPTGDILVWMENVK